ncbi:hypothetical protein, partial [Actinoplanes philippinensis]|uniref:hypothetical protein n=1 Tax=Actinoplanes philippinensis TaxID=35752 RepID=UPI0019452A42
MAAGRERLPREAGLSGGRGGGRERSWGDGAVVRPARAVGWERLPGEAGLSGGRGGGWERSWGDGAVDRSTRAVGRERFRVESRRPAVRGRWKVAAPGGARALEGRGARRCAGAGRVAARRP